MSLLTGCVVYLVKILQFIVTMAYLLPPTQHKK